MKLNIKKYVCITTALFCLLSTCCSVSASSTPTIYAIKTECSSGEVIRFPITLVDNPGITSLSISVEFDDTIFELIAVDDSGLLPGKMHSDNYSSPYQLEWENDASTQNYTDVGRLVTLYFSIPDDVPDGHYPVTINHSDNFVIDKNYDDVAIVFSDGELIVSEDGHTTVWGQWEYYSAIQHKRACECGAQQFEEHTWDTGVIVSPPSGVKIYTCKTCDGTKTEEIFADEENNDTPNIPSRPITPTRPTYTCPYTDISNHWAKDIIKYIDKLSLVDGETETTFAPDKPMTRESFVTAMARLADVERNYVDWAINIGLLKGYGNGEYGLNDTITREQMAVFFLRFLELTNIDYEDCKTIACYNFADDEQIADWAKEAVYEMQALDLIHGKGNDVFDPKGLTTRAEGATVLYNLCKTVLNK